MCACVLFWARGEEDSDDGTGGESFSAGVGSLPPQMLGV